MRRSSISLILYLLVNFTGKNNDLSAHISIPCYQQALKNKSIIDLNIMDFICCIKILKSYLKKYVVLVGTPNSHRHLDMSLPKPCPP